MRIFLSAIYKVPGLVWACFPPEAVFCSLLKNASRDSGGGEVMIVGVGGWLEEGFAKNGRENLKGTAD